MGRVILEKEVSGSMARGGDRNTQFFHHATIQRRRGNLIKRLQMVNGSWTEDERQIREECLRYFKGIFQTEGCMGMEEQLASVPRVIDERINEKLTRRVSKEQVKKQSSS